MKARNLLAQRVTALDKTNRQINAVEDANIDGRYNAVLDQLYIKRTRQEKAVQAAEAQVELFSELDIDF